MAVIDTKGGLCEKSLWVHVKPHTCQAHMLNVLVTGCSYTQLIDLGHGEHLLHNTPLLLSVCRFSSSEHSTSMPWCKHKRVRTYSKQVTFIACGYDTA